MHSEDAVEAAIADFTDWNCPWTFYSFVHESVGDVGQPRFEAIWQEAMKAEHSNSTSLQECATNAANALSQKFPHMKPGAIQAVANAAAYQWK